MAIRLAMKYPEIYRATYAMSPGPLAIDIDQFIQIFKKEWLTALSIKEMNQLLAAGKFPRMMIGGAAAFSPKPSLTRVYPMSLKNTMVTISTALSSG